jgi:predicted nucleotidyltransferase
MSNLNRWFDLYGDEQEVLSGLKRYGIDGIDSVIEEAELTFSGTADLTGKELEKVLMLLDWMEPEVVEKVMAAYYDPNIQQ